jgi:hypothetical protein
MSSLSRKNKSISEKRMDVIAQVAPRGCGVALYGRHCEEPTGPALLGRPDDRLRDEAIHSAASGEMDCFASLSQ